MVLLITLLASTLLTLTSAIQTSAPSRNCGNIAALANTTSFTLKEYLVETVKSGTGTRLRGTFTIVNPAAGDDVYRLYHIPVSTGGGTWSVCQTPAEDGVALPAQLVKCQYLIERWRKTIGFRFQWYCDAPGNTNAPILVDATVIGELPTEICVDKTEGTVTQSCAFSADVKGIALDVANISWEDVLPDGRAIQ